MPTASPAKRAAAAVTARVPRAIDAKMGQKFADTLYAEARHKALFGGRGSGKSWAVATYLASVASKSRKRIVCARQFQNSIRDSSKELIEQRIRDLALSNQFSITDRYIFHNTNKSQFLFVGLERNIESIRSLEGADIVWVEEARTVSARSLEVLLPTIRKSSSEFIWTWNPEQPEDPIDAYFRSGPPPPRSIVTRVDFHDNPYFQGTEMPGELEVLKRGNPMRYRHVWLGEYDTRYESKIFPNAKVGRADVPPDTAPRYGMDFGFGGDPSFVVKVYIIEGKKQIYIAGEAFGRVAMERLPTMMRSVLHSDDDLVRADSSLPGTIEFLQARGFNMVPARKGPGSVKSGIMYLQSYEILIDPSCEGMREEARLYSWMTDRITGKVLSTPVDAHNHGWDAVRYAVENDMGNPAADDDGVIDSGVLSLKLW
jgi:phage terminase large subunit